MRQTLFYLYMVFFVALSFISCYDEGPDVSWIPTVVEPDSNGPIDDPDEPTDDPEGPIDDPDEPIDDPDDPIDDPDDPIDDPEGVIVYKVGKNVEFKMVYVEGGTFTMGATPDQQTPDSDEKPTHRVTLSSYMIGETEVTQELWQAVMGTNPSYFKGTTNPVEKVSWDDCQDFVRKLNSLTGQTFRLPTEAEWEYAARGGSKSKGYQYSGSNNINDVAWYTVNSYDKGSNSPDYGTHPVATKAPNELGIYDMSGNVFEWCQDWYGSYSSSAQTNPQGPSSESRRVVRGGSWYYGARNCRSAYRNRSGPDLRDIGLGLRLVLSE